MTPHLRSLLYVTPREVLLTTHLIQDPLSHSFFAWHPGFFQQHICQKLILILACILSDYIYSFYVSLSPARLSYLRLGVISVTFTLVPLAPNSVSSINGDLMN